MSAIPPAHLHLLESSSEAGPLYRCEAGHTICRPCRLPQQVAEGRRGMSLALQSIEPLNPLADKIDLELDRKCD